MDELIAAYINITFSDEFKQEIYRCFDIFNKFNYNTASVGFIDLLTDTSSRQTDDIRDSFIAELNVKLDFVLNEHLLVLHDIASIYQKNEVLMALYLVMDLEDYTSVICVLESLKDEHEKLATIVSDLSALDIMDMMVLVDTFDIALLDRLKQFIYNKEKPVENAIKNKGDIIANLKLFINIYGTDNIGYDLTTSGILLGQSFASYIPHIWESILVNDISKIAINVLSIIYMTADSLTDPLAVYRNHSADLLADLNQISRVEVFIIAAINKVNEAKDAVKAAKVHNQADIPLNLENKENENEEFRLS